MVELVLFLPFVTFLVSLLFGRLIPAQTGMAVACAAMVLATIIAWLLVLPYALGEGTNERIVLGEWFVAGDLEVVWSIRLDALSALMFALVTTVAALALALALGSMRGEANGFWFAGCLSLTAFAALLLVSADTLVQLYFGWEGVAVGVFLLVAYQSARAGVRSAAVQFVTVQRLGSVALLVAFAVLVVATGSVNLGDVFEALPVLADTQTPVLGLSLTNLVGLLVVLATVVRAGQVMFHGWWATAIAAPTPAAALIMTIGAGAAAIFVVLRLSPLLEFAPVAAGALVAAGGLTAVVGAVAACAHVDLRDALGCFAASQLGLVLMAVGLGAYGAAALQLVAFVSFGTLMLFGLGSVVTALRGEHDVRRMGGLWRSLPLAHAGALVGVLSAAGLPFATGQLARDGVAEAALAEGGIAVFALVFATAFLTALFGWRLVLSIFYGKTRAASDTFKGAREPSITLGLTMVPLAVGALAGGALLASSFGAYAEGPFWNGAFFSGQDGTVHDSPSWVMPAMLAASVGGFVVALVRHLTASGRGGFGAGVLPKFIRRAADVVPVYQVLGVAPALAIGRWLWWVDHKIIDTFAVDGVASGTTTASGAVRRLQSGGLYHYVFVMIAGLAVLIALMLASARGIF